MSRRINILFDGEDVGASNTIEGVRESLQDIKEESPQTSAALASIAGGAEVAEESLEEVEDAAEDLDDDLDGTALSIAGLGGALGKITSETSDGFEQLQVDAQDAKNSLQSVEERLKDISVSDTGISDEGREIISFTREAEEGFVNLNQAASGLHNADLFKESGELKNFIDTVQEVGTEDFNFLKQAEDSEDILLDVNEQLGDIDNNTQAISLQQLLQDAEDAEKLLEDDVSLFADSERGGGASVSTGGSAGTVTTGEIDVDEVKESVEELDSNLTPAVRERPDIPDEATRTSFTFGQLQEMAEARQSLDTPDVQPTETANIPTGVTGAVPSRGREVRFAEALVSEVGETEPMDTPGEMPRGFPDAFGAANINARAEDRASGPFDEGVTELLAEAHQNATKASKELTEANKELAFSAGTTETEVRDEAKEMMNAADNADNLAEMKEAASDANSLLKEAAGLSTEELKKEARAEALAAEEGMSLERAKKKVAESSDDLIDAGIMTEQQMVNEAESFEEAAIAADSLEGMKEAVSGANEKLARQSSETHQEILREKDAILQAEASADSTSEALRSLSDGNTRLSSIAAETRDRLDELDEKQSTNTLSALMYAASNMTLSSSLDSVDDEAEEAGDEVSDLSSDLMKGAFAAELFSGNFGSLSLNLGAVNIALRNMTRQVPFLITTLGTLVSVVGGLGASALSAGTALAGIFGAGVLAQAREFADNVDRVENTTEGIEAVMANVKEQFAAAAEPLIGAEGTVDFFVNTMNALAQEVNVLARTIRNMMPMFLEFASSIGSVADSEFNNFLEAMAQSFIMLEPMLESFITFFLTRIPDAIVFFSKITSMVGDEFGEFIRTFISFAADLIQIGASIQSGILPVITDFVAILEQVAEAILQIGTQNIANIAAGIGALLIADKVAASLAGLTSISIRVTDVFVDLSSNVSEASGVMGKFRAVLGSVSSATQMALLRLDGFRAIQKVLQAELVQLITTVGIGDEALASFGNAGTLSAIKLAILQAQTGRTEEAMEELIDDTEDATIKSLTFTQALRGQAEALEEVEEESEDAGLSFDVTEGKLGKLAGTFVGTKIAFEGLRSRMSGGMKRLRDESGLVRKKAGNASSKLEALGIAVGGIAKILSGASLSIGALGTVAGIIIAGAKAFLAFAVVGTLLVGVLGNLEKASSGVKNSLSVIFKEFKALVGYLLEKFIPIWNSVASVVALVFNLLGAFTEEGNSLNGILNFTIGLIRGFVDVLFGFVQAFAAVFGFVASLFNDLLKLLGAETVMTGDDLRVDKEDVRTGAAEAQSTAEDLVGRDRQTPEFNQTNVSQNYGDVNADPKEKEAMKRLIKDAMMEANTYRRQNDGFSG